MNLDQTRVLHRQTHTMLPTAVGGEGVHLIDREGKRYIDASGGAAVSCLGHGHPEVRAAMHRQIDELAYAHTSFFTTDVAESLADHLVEHAPGDLSHVYFVSGGSEAVETALKMARQYFVEIGQPQRKHFIARKQSYHGNTLGALAVGGNVWRRKQFAPLLIDVSHVSPCYAYRHQAEDESPEAYGQRLVQELSAEIERLGGEHIIAFIAETIGGATAGVLTPVPGYFKGVRELCDRHGILLILDEVMCGMGRSGRRFAFEDEGVVPDIVTVAKGLGGGYQPIGATLARRHIVDAFAQGSGLFQHGHTYLGHATACAAALTVQQVIERDGLLAQVRERGQALQALLRAAFADHAHVGDIRGRGLFWGIELVQDRASKAAFDPALKLHARIKAQAMKHGLLCYPAGGTVDGQSGDHVLLAPPFISSPQDLEAIVERLHAAIENVLHETFGVNA
jgi:adenosylmethionine-8-amino-7-oxononanoate aminotransferase